MKEGEIHRQKLEMMEKEENSEQLANKIKQTRCNVICIECAIINVKLTDGQWSVVINACFRLGANPDKTNL